jgi:epoxyqueuosine reductase QueG
MMNSVMELNEHIRSLARSLGIVDIGSADASAWDTDVLVSKIIPENERPRSLMQNSRSVISIGIPVQRAILATAPSVYYSEHYKIINSVLDNASQRIAAELNILGYPSIFVSRDGYQGIEGLRKDASSFFSHRHAAYLAGLGTFGMNNMLLTEKNGPRIRFTSVITTVDMRHNSPSGKKLCTECMRCRTECPDDAVAYAMYPKGLTDKRRCVERSAILRDAGRSPCGRCIFVCPVGKDINENVPTDEAIMNVQRYGK